MGRKSGITSGGYHPRIHKMKWVMEHREMAREQEDLIMSKTKTSANYWKQRFHNAVDYLKAADPKGWEAWFDDDKNLPAVARSEELAKLIEARVVALNGPTSFPTSTLHRSIFIWEDKSSVYTNNFSVYSKEIGKDQLYVNEFNSISDARNFIDSLSSKNLGYGVVLDIIPVPALSEVRSEVG